MRFALVLCIFWILGTNPSNADIAMKTGPENREENVDSTATSRTSDVQAQPEIRSTNGTSSAKTMGSLSNLATTESSLQNENQSSDDSNAVKHAEAATIENPSLGAGKQRLWGSPAPFAEEEYDKLAKGEFRRKEEQDNALHNSVHIPFVPKSTHPPPTGFAISARVYIDPNDKLGHIDEDPSLMLPYWDCGAVGSTTSPLAIKEATFRHSLTPSQVWTGTDGKHPILAVALSEFLLEVSSGATKAIHPGQAILLEDVLIPGHRLKPINHHDVRVMLLTLPRTHYSIGKDQISIPITAKKMGDPCPVSSNQDKSSIIVLQQMGREKGLLRVLLGITGLSLSTIMADFIGKTAPLWLAVGVGGTFFVLSGTICTIMLGEVAYSNFQAWAQQRRLRTSATTFPRETKEPL